MISVVWRGAIVLGLLSAAAACQSSSLDCVFQPGSVDWGEVDFQEEMPEGGYDPREVALVNEGDATVDSLTMREHDQELLCIPGFDGQSGPYELPSLRPGSSFLMTVSVCGYVLGTRDTPVEGTIEVTDGQELVARLPWTFTPIRNIGGTDTGR